ncbi:MAG: beta-lactamase family protein [Sphingomonadaceae bacterium]|nr:beta-lactamase family protein [Sphingomonadaceae bacterium]
MMEREFLESALDRRSVMRFAAIAGLAPALMPNLAWAITEPAMQGHLHAFVERWVGPGKLPGMVVALGLPGYDTKFIMRGSEGFDDPDSITPDSLFRIYSMTKPITGMATMLLIGEGKLGLDQPLADILPKFGKMQVQVTPDGSITDLRPAKTHITIRHLLTHTSGLAYGIIQKGPIRDALREKGLIPGKVTRLKIPGMSRGNHVQGLEAFADGMADMPLVYEPATTWSYSPGLDILGRVIEVVTGQGFDTFLRERLFDPLGMTSTFFKVPSAEAARLTTNYGVFKTKLVPIDKPSNSVFLDQPPFPFGGSGLVSTPRDYDRFLRMIGNYGMSDGKRVMGELAVRVGTSNLLPRTVDPADIRFVPNSHFGAGGRIGTGPEAGIFGWSGAAGTVGMVDMRSGMTSSIFVQFMPPTGLEVLPEFQQALRADVTALMERRR